MCFCKQRYQSSAHKSGSEAGSDSSMSVNVCDHVSCLHIGGSICFDGRPMSIQANSHTTVSSDTAIVYPMMPGVDLALVAGGRVNWNNEQNSDRIAQRSRLPVPSAQGCLQAKTSKRSL
jgi:hypothetical protein